MNNTSTAQETKWYNKPPFPLKAFIFFAFIVFFPLGIFLLWKSGKVKTGWKAVFTVIGAFWGLIVMVAIFAPETPEMIAQEKRDDSLVRVAHQQDQEKIKENEIESTIKNMSLEEQLATLDANGVPAKKDDIKTVRIKALLEFLSNSYSEPKDTIADLTSRVQGILEEKYGIKESCLHILEEMNTMGKIENTKYSSAITLYLMARSHQSSETK